MRLPFLGEARSNDSADVIRFLEGCLDAGLSKRRLFEPEWGSNALFLWGDQWEEAMTWPNGTTRRVPVSRPATAKAKLTTNLILPLVRQGAAALRNNVSQQMVVPASLSESDVAAADLGTDVLQWRFVQDDEETLRLWEILNAMVYGRVLRKVVWDPTLDGIGPTGKLMKGVGDIRTHILQPETFVVCPYDKTPFNISWVIEFDVWDLDEVREVWPGADVKPEEVSSFGLNSGLNSAYQPDRRRKNACILKQMYFAPTKKYENGKLMIWAGQSLLHDGELPDGLFPFVPIDWMWCPDRLYPLPFITPLRDPQLQSNITKSQLIELKNRQLRGDMLVHGPTLPKQEIGDDGQKFILVPQSSNAELMKYDLKTSDAREILMTLWNDLMQISGIHEQSLGQAVQREVTATQVQMLREADLEGLELFQQGLDRSQCAISKLKLQLIQRHYKAPRLLTILEGSDKVKAVAFYGSDLKGASDVRARAVPLMSEAQRQMVKQQLVERGAYGPYQNIGHMKAGAIMILNSGLPNADQEVAKLLYPMTYDQLIQLCGEYEMLSAQVQISQLQNMLMQLQMQAAAAMQSVMGGQEQQQAEATDQYGMPVEPESAEYGSPPYQY